VIPASAHIIPAECTHTLAPHTPSKHKKPPTPLRTCSRSCCVCCPASTAATYVSMMLLMAVGASWCGQWPAGASSR
jgi:hypothetical protein